MKSPHLITLLSLLANILLIATSSSSSSPNQNYDDFLECLTDQFQRSNSATDVIYTPQNATYASLLLAQNLRPAATAPERPELIITPRQESEIQAAIHCSKKLNLPIRTKSGGHDFEGLSYTSQTPFVVVDMRNFRSVTISGDGKTAWVQTGATIGQLYHTLALRSRTLAFPAGVCPTVGVGGHFSGGGFGMMSRKYALAADHIVDARIVNADGEIVDRRNMGEDLFWAIRGGGGTSFGIVLEFKVTLVTVPEIVTVFNVTRRLEENATELVHRWQFVADKIADELLIRIFLHPDVSPTTGNRTVAASFTSLFLGRARDLLQIMQREFPELGLKEQDCQEMSWIDSELFFSELRDQPLDVLLDRVPRGSTYFKGKSDYVSTPFPLEALRGIWRFLIEEDGSELQFSPYGGAFNAFSEAETPFPHRRGTIFMIEYIVGWANLNQSDAHLDWLRRLYDYMESYVTKSPRAAYVNYRDLDIGRNNIEGETSYEQASVWGLRYFNNNFRRLVRVKTKVDPDNFFRNEQSIPPISS
ncbi:berberine bridge enzyme-like 18 isoform X1 [Salvia splendens]|uniref:berberine bridge enzyme-like 18 isoform X1 n=1 Tax=Salvia splendens TaxID=180675 RepID=UPI001100239D|nr:berberine bridge enzyme-like 18 isoform X1 [Salvia splendens]